MAERGRFYWVKLKNTFFDEKAVKFLRRQSNGDTLVIIYLKLILYTLDKGGYFTFEGFANNIYDEISIALEENTTDCERAVTALLQFGLLSAVCDDKLYVTSFSDMVGSETASAQRMRDKRERDKNELSQCDIFESLSDVEKS